MQNTHTHAKTPASMREACCSVTTLICLRFPGTLQHRSLICQGFLTLYKHTKYDYATSSHAAGHKRTHCFTYPHDAQAAFTKHPTNPATRGTQIQSKAGRGGGGVPSCCAAHTELLRSTRRAAAASCVRGCAVLLQYNTANTTYTAAA